jgi:hypothetical protein
MLDHADNFNTYGTLTALLLEGVYAEIRDVALVADPDGVSTERVLRYNENASAAFDAIARRVLSAASVTSGVASRFWLDRLPTTTTEEPSIRWADAGNNQIARLRVMTTGGLQLVDHNNNVIAQTPGPVVTANGWFHYEAKLTCGLLLDAEFECRIEGRVVLTHSGFSTSDAAADQIITGVLSTGTGSNPAMYHKDYVIWDGTGTYNNDFLGGVRVYELYTIADVIFPWLSTGPDGFSVLDNNPPTDVDYIYADLTMPAQCEFTMSNLPADVSSVKGVFIKYRAGKSDGGDGQLQAGVISNAVAGLGTDRPITFAQTYWTDLFEEDPDTNAPWVPGAVDAMTVTLDRTV